MLGDEVDGGVRASPHLLPHMKTGKVSAPGAAAGKRLAELSERYGRVAKATGMKAG